MRHGTFGSPTVPVGVGNLVTTPLLPDPDPDPEPEPDPDPDPEPFPDPEPWPVPDPDPDPDPVEPVPAPAEPVGPLVGTPGECCAPGLPLTLVTAPALSPDVAALTGV